MRNIEYNYEYISTVQFSFSTLTGLVSVRKIVDVTYLISNVPFDITLHDTVITEEHSSDDSSINFTQIINSSVKS